MEQKDMTGALFRQVEKHSAKSPDYTGRVTIDAVTYRLSGWVREKDGRKCLGCSNDATDPPGRCRGRGVAARALAQAGAGSVRPEAHRSRRKGTGKRRRSGMSGRTDQHESLAME